VADLVLNSNFPADELERQRQQRLDNILQEKSSPSATARRVFRSVLFGDRHPFGLQTAGNESSIRAITRKELTDFHRIYWKPSNAVLLFAGDIRMSEAIQLVNEDLSSWEDLEVPQVCLPEVSPPQGIHIFLVDRQDAPQSQIRIGSTGPSRKTVDYYAIELMNAILGGSFTSRLNLNLREDKGYTYGASTGFAYGREAGFWAGGTAVQTLVTSQALIELRKEVSAIRRATPITNAELTLAKQNLVRGFAQRFETLGRLIGQMSELFAYDLSVETMASYPEAIDSVGLAEVQAAAEKYLKDDELVIVVVGDLGQVEENIRKLDLGKVTVVDFDGERLK